MDNIPWGPQHPKYFDTAEEFFGTDPSAEFDRWSLVQYWTQDEGIALSFGLDPRVVNWAALRNYPEHPHAVEYDRRRDLAARAVRAGELQACSPPRRFIEWAKRIGIIFPDTLSQMVKPMAVARGKSTQTSASGLKKLINTLSRIALAMADYSCGFSPEHPNEQEYETMAAELQEVGISVTIESIKWCLKAPEDLYENLSKVEEILSKVVLGMAICHFEYDPKAPRSHAPKLIADVVGSISVDTIHKRLKEAATNIGLV